MINIIITSYNEPKATIRAVNAFLNQNIEQPFKIIVVDPFPAVGVLIKKEIKDKRVDFFLDPGEGKAYALNILFQDLFSNRKEDLFILTDGDVFVSNDAISEMLNYFKDPKIGCVTGKPVPLNSRNTKYGYWSHFLLDGIDKTRKKFSRKREFFECSGYLFAIRNGVLGDFPSNVSEDSIIPYLFWKKGYSIVYAPNAKVYVKNPTNWKDWINQKVRNIKGHENLNRIAPDLPRTKSFLNEVKEGGLFFLKHPKTIKESLWCFELYIARLYLYFKAFREIKQRKHYSDGWRVTEIKSTKPLD